MLYPQIKKVASRPVVFFPLENIPWRKPIDAGQSSFFSSERDRRNVLRITEKQPLPIWNPSFVSMIVPADPGTSLQVEAVACRHNWDAD